jgi:chromosome segregation ATPase
MRDLQGWAKNLPREEVTKPKTKSLSERIAEKIFGHSANRGKNSLRVQDAARLIAQEIEPLERELALLKSEAMSDPVKWAALNSVQRAEKAESELVRVRQERQEIEGARAGATSRAERLERELATKRQYIIDSDAVLKALGDERNAVRERAETAEAELARVRQGWDDANETITRLSENLTKTEAGLLTIRQLKNKLLKSLSIKHKKQRAAERKLAEQSEAVRKLIEAAAESLRTTVAGELRCPKCEEPLEKSTILGSGYKPHECRVAGELRGKERE